MQKTVFLFAGQGCHYAQMGRPLFESDPVFREAIFRAERIARQAGGASIIDPVFSDTDDWLLDLRVSHAAIFSFQWAVVETLKSKGLLPGACLGTSLGEFVALCASGAADFADMLTFVVRQSRTIVEQLPPGGMVTVLASSEFYWRHPEIFAGCALAAENFDAHIVISGAVDVLRRCCLALADAGISACPLPVPFAFHSGQVAAVRAPFFEAAQGLALRRGDVPVISCVDPVGELTKPDVGHLWRIVEQPFYFLRAVRQVEQAMQRPIYMDCSPSGTLANFLRYILGADAQERVKALYAPGRAELALGNAL